ncbi:MAG: RNA polymerase sigma factor [Methylococcales bacterium]|nr:RNA polymerase sigma factor [Methylococcales bacterium]
MSKHRFFETLFRHHRLELLSFANSSFSQIDAEDLVQEAYLRLLQHPDSATIQNPRAYLYKIIANLGFDYHRHDKVHKKHFDSDTEVVFDNVHSPQPEIAAHLDSQQILKQCLQALNELPDVYRHVFLLHRFDGKSHSEIAQALNLPQRTVERYCAKALAHCFAKSVGQNL